MTARLLLLCVVAVLSGIGTAWCRINLRAVEFWAKELGDRLWDLGQICGLSDLDSKYGHSNAYNRPFKTEVKDQKSLVQGIAASIHNMTQLKLSAIRRIAESAETLAHRSYKKGNSAENYTTYKYYGTKAYDPAGEPLDFVQYLNCTQNRHFYNEEVNTTFSSVHVPTNIYHRAHDILKVINWTQDLDPIFRSNYEQDPSLSWQYFGSSSGIMRQYPGVFKNDSQVDMVDMFDCRMRLWYIDASLSPKDIIILVDNSGSMTGTSREIARHVVNSILETLGSNDFVNVLMFNDTVAPVISCLRNDTLIQANLGNVREFKLAMKTLEAERMANFRVALTEAFKSFNKSVGKNYGASCNRAIMVITDSMPDIYKDIFEEYNWRANMHVRMFTYQIGDEEPGAYEMQWIAHNNNGCYVSLRKPAEVREKVLRYMSIMSQPLVLLGERPISWTPLYASLVDPLQTDFLWLQRENKEQAQVSDFCYFPKRFPTHTYNVTGKVFKNCSQDPRITRAQDPIQSTLVYHYVISVSMPVLDVGENKTKTAQIVGVAGTDVPVEDIKKLLFLHKVGVNGYVFMITNNGHVIIHPDLRPEFLGLLKPNYNSVDLTEVEHVDDNSIRVGSADPGVIEMRKAMIDQKYGDKSLLLKYHFDHMKRVSTVRRQYTYIGIKDTPFAIGIVLPCPYGIYIAQPVRNNIQILTTRKPAREYNELIKHIKDFSQGGNWTVHPDWVYCKYYHDTAHEFSTSESELQRFLEQLRVGRGFQCSTLRHLIPPEQINRASYPKLKIDSCYCDMELFNSLIDDAIGTRFWSKRNFTVEQDKIMKFGVSVVFLATRSGLTRWQTFKGDKGTCDFKAGNTKTIDEVWYQRAVDLQEESGTFVYSVPFSDGRGNNNNAVVTASYAVFTENNKSIPLAVVGHQFQHLKLLSEFNSITAQCKDCTSCSSDELACYIIDNNGFIVVSEDVSETGKFFGEVEGNAMNLLIEEQVFRKVHIFDYQAICLREDGSKSDASFVTKPVQHLLQIFEWFIGTIVSLFAVWRESWTNGRHLLWINSLNLGTQLNNYYSDLNEETIPVSKLGTMSKNAGCKNVHTEKAEQCIESAKVKPTQLPREDVKINRTHLEPCIKEMDLYQLQNISHLNSKIINSSKCLQHIVVQKLSHTNLILVVVDILCSQNIWQEVRITKVEVSGSDIFCLKARNDELARKKPKTCVGRDKTGMLQEPHNAECGCDSRLHADTFLMLICWCVGILRSTKH